MASNDSPSGGGADQRPARRPTHRSTHFQRHLAVTKLQFRSLVLLLAVRRIPFTWRRENNVYICSFESRYTKQLMEAAGA